MATSCSPQTKIVAFSELVVAWADRNLRTFPWRSPRVSPYQVLIAEVLLKRTTARAASRVYQDFLSRYPTVLILSSATEKELTRALSTVGLQRQRARTLSRMGKYLIEEQGGDIPHELEKLRELPGVGEYSARAILSFAFDRPVAILDANVIRVLRRVFRSTLPMRAGERFLQGVADKLLPQADHKRYNWALLDIGAVLCRYVDPRCIDCPLNSCCDYYIEVGASRSKAGDSPVVQVRKERLNRLREIRLSKQLSLIQLADQAGVSKLTVINIEAGRTSPLDSTIQKLAAVLNVRPNSILRKQR